MLEHLTQLLVENNPACVLSNIYPALGCIYTHIYYLLYTTTEVSLSKAPNAQAPQAL